MQKTKLFYIMIFLLVAAIFSSIMPYPIFSNYTNITEKNAYEINNYNEIELENKTNQNQTILDLEWKDINLLMEIDEEYEIFDISTEQSFFVKRTGGKNHADVETVDKKNSQILHETFDEIWKWDRKPVLVKLNDNAYLPASLSGYPHGHSNTDNGLLGHFCLHFKGSKTHGTNIVDDYHQKTVAHALKHGEKILRNQ